MFTSTLLLAVVCSAPPVDGEQILQDVNGNILTTTHSVFVVNEKMEEKVFVVGK